MKTIEQTIENLERMQSMLAIRDTNYDRASGILPRVQQLAPALLTAPVAMPPAIPQSEP